MNILTHALLISSLFLKASFCLSQETTKERIAHFNIKKVTAISGYDPVSYFSNSPTQGKPQISYTHKGVVYLFASDKNKKIFIEHPSKYEPTYGGWCAYAMGLEKPKKVSINPKTYKIIDGKLYLFYNKFGINTKQKWDEEGETKLKNNANKNWNKIISE